MNVTQSPEVFILLVVIAVVAVTVDLGKLLVYKLEWTARKDIVQQNVSPQENIAKVNKEDYGDCERWL